MGKIFLQRSNGQLLGHEERLIYQHCVLERLQTELFDFKALSRRKIDLGSCSLIVGSVEAISCAMKLLGIPVPIPNYYPEELSSFLYRPVWQGRPADVWARVIADRPVFAKSVKWKKLTGQLFDSGSGTEQLAAISKNEKLWLSEPVNWVSEYRVYVTNHKVSAICFYDGDEKIHPDQNVIESAVSTMKNAAAPDSYAIDWGVLDNGQTALIEMGDAWATGAYYGISPRLYFDFLFTRWAQLIKTKM